MSFVDQYLLETQQALEMLSRADIEKMAKGLAEVREGGGRLFILGIGGSAAHASHAVNDFRKICQFEAYAPTDNVSELTARVNDQGWHCCLVEWLKVSRLSSRDALLVFSVGGGDLEKNLSVNLVEALRHAVAVRAKVFGVTGRTGGYTKRVADACLVIPTVSAERVTPHTEGICAVVWHLLVSHPELKVAQTTWETLMTKADRPWSSPFEEIRV